MSALSLMSLSPFDFNSPSFRTHSFRSAFLGESFFATQGATLRDKCDFVIRDRHNRIVKNARYFLAADGSAIHDYQLFLEGVGESSRGCYYSEDWSDDAVMWKEGGRFVVETPDGVRYEQNRGETNLAFEERIDGEIAMDYNRIRKYLPNEPCSLPNSHKVYQCRCNGLQEGSGNQAALSEDSSGCECSAGYERCTDAEPIQGEAPCLTPSQCSKITSCKNLVANVANMEWSADKMDCDCKDGYSFDKDLNECVDEQGEIENPLWKFVKDNSYLLIGVGVVFGLGSALR